MISYIKGKVTNIDGNHILVVTEMDIGYQLNIGREGMFLEGEEVELFIKPVVRENDFSLWAFKSFVEYKLFEILISVSGVGPKTAQSIIVEKGVSNIVNSIIEDDYKSLKVSGVGEKTAQKIAIMLKDKILKKFSGQLDQKSQVSVNPISNEAIDALIALGYRSIDATNAIVTLQREYKYENVQKLITDALKQL